MVFDFDWDSLKANANFRKHGVSFVEAVSVFHDPLAVTYPDGEHSMNEPRFLTFGMSSRERILVVSHCESSRGVRIISARRVSREERRIYEEGG